MGILYIKNKMHEIEHDSKTIKKSWYNSLTQELTIEFRSGSLYIYSGIDENLWTEFITAISAGKALNDLIKGKFNYRKVEEEDGN